MTAVSTKHSSRRTLWKRWRRRTLEWFAIHVFGRLLLPLLVRSWRVASTDFPTDWLARANAGERVILAFWHNRQIGLLRLASMLRPVSVLVSRHGDGEIITRIMARWGVGAIRGSSTRGGSTALRQMIASARDTHIGITPDGPVGPRYEVKEGVITLAALAHVPVFWVSWSSDRVWVFRSWDRFILPKPFARLHFHATGPLLVPDTVDTTEADRCRADLEQRMRAQTAELDAAVGVDIDPALTPRSSPVGNRSGRSGR